MQRYTTISETRARRRKEEAGAEVDEGTGDKYAEGKEA